MCQTNCIAVTRNLETRLHSTNTTYSTKDVRNDCMNSQLIRSVDEDRRYDSRSAERRLIIERDSRRPNKGRIYGTKRQNRGFEEASMVVGIRKKIGRTRPSRFIVRMVEGRRRYQGSRLRPREIDKVCHREGSPQPSSQVNSASQLFSNRKLLKWLSSLKIDFVYADETV